MFDLIQTILDLSVSAFRNKVDLMPREEVVAVSQRLEARSTELQLAMDSTDDQDIFRQKGKARGTILAKLRICQARLAALKADAVTLGIFVRMDEEGLPVYFQRAARMSPAAYNEALLGKHGAQAPVMIDHHRVSAEAVPIDLWDDLSLDTETLHTTFSR
jgi:hypothetical protein